MDLTFNYGQTNRHLEKKTNSRGPSGPKNI